MMINDHGFYCKKYLFGALACKIIVFLSALHIWLLVSLNNAATLSKPAGLPFAKFRPERCGEDAASLGNGLPARFEPHEPRFKVAIFQVNPLGKFHG